MHPLVSFNKRILPVSNAALPAVSSAAFYGRGIFTTLAICLGKPFLQNLHDKRLRENASRIGLDVSNVSFNELQDNLLELIKINKVNDGRARITLFDSSGSPIWQSLSEKDTSVLITTAEHRKPPPDNLNLTVSPMRVNSTSPLAGVKSCNYLENILALEAAQTNGFAEAVRLNERGEIVSATMANLFWTKDEMIFTPALQTGALGGTTRECVISLAQNINLKIVEALALLADLQVADEIFLTSAGLGVCSVKSLGSHFLSDRITSKIRTAFSELINQ